MEATTLTEEKQINSLRGTTQLLCETYIELKPPMSELLAETWVAEITDSSIYENGVLVTGQLTHTFQYLHPHGQKSNDDQQDQKDKKRANDTEQLERFSVLSGNGGGELISSSKGIVHFHQQVLNFAGNIAMPSIGLSHVITGKAAVQVAPVPVFVAHVIEDNGLVSGGKKTFKLDIAITATPPEA